MVAVSQCIPKLKDVIQKTNRTACVQLLLGQFCGGVTDVQTITVLEVLWSGFCVISGNLVFSAIIGEATELLAMPTEG